MWYGDGSRSEEDSSRSEPVASAVASRHDGQSAGHASPGGRRPPQRGQSDLDILPLVTRAQRICALTFPSTMHNELAQKQEAARQGYYRAVRVSSILSWTALVSSACSRAKRWRSEVGAVRRTASSGHRLWPSEKLPVFAALSTQSDSSMPIRTPLSAITMRPKVCIETMCRL